MVMLVLWTGLDDLEAAFAAGGWQLGWLVPYYLVPALCAALSWRWLFPPGAAPLFGLIIRGTWIGLAINWLLPVAQIGGEVVRARLLILRRFPAAVGIASVTVDQVLQLATQFAYVLLGLALFALLSREMITEASSFASVLVASALLGIVAYAVYRMTRRGLFERLAGTARRILRNQTLAGVAAKAPDVDDAIAVVYGQPRRLVVAAAWRMGFRLALAGELWLASRFLGRPVSFAEAIVLDSLGQAARAAAFLIPAGLGVQEGAFMALVVALGSPAEAGLVLSLARRVRELLVGVPGVVAWQVEEIAQRRLPGQRSFDA